MQQHHLSHTYHRLRTNSLQLKASFFFIGSANLINSDSRRIDEGSFCAEKIEKEANNAALDAFCATRFLNFPGSEQH